MMTVAMLGAMWWEEPTATMFAHNAGASGRAGGDWGLATGAFGVQMWAATLAGPASRIIIRGRAGYRGLAGLVFPG